MVLTLTLILTLTLTTAGRVLVSQLRLRLRLRGSRLWTRGQGRPHASASASRCCHRHRCPAMGRVACASTTLVRPGRRPCEAPQTSCGWCHRGRRGPRRRLSAATARSDDAWPCWCVRTPCAQRCVRGCGAEEVSATGHESAAVASVCYGAQRTVYSTAATMAPRGVGVLPRCLRTGPRADRTWCAQGLEKQTFALPVPAQSFRQSSGKVAPGCPPLQCFAAVTAPESGHDMQHPPLHRVSDAVPCA